jgi:hypothetical protein
MAAGFEGKWKLDSSENFDEFMKVLGVGYLTRKAGGASKPTVVISKDGDKWTMVTESSVKTTKISFKFGEEFEEHTADGRKVLSTFTKDSDRKWTQVQKADIPSTYVRELTDDNTLVTICTAKDVTSKRVYKRA